MSKAITDSRNVPNTRYAILSMDIEDWFHLDYFNRPDCDEKTSLLDGVEVYCHILRKHGIHSSFFTVGEIATTQPEMIRKIVSEGHEVGCHTHDHKRPMTRSLAEFSADLEANKVAVNDATGIRPEGFRAPCFSLDRQRLDAVAMSGFTYDSSRIQFSGHPLYGTLDLDGYSKVAPGIYRNACFFEFELPTLPVSGKNLPISGGGYIRLFPWILMKFLIGRHLAKGKPYVLYIHPFELSPIENIPLPKSSRIPTRFRFSHGRASVPGKLEKLIILLKNYGYGFHTFSELRKHLLKSC